MGRSNDEPVFFMSAGDKLTVTDLRSAPKPEAGRAHRTRVRPSPTARSARPTTATPGRPELTETSICTRRASTPQSIAVLTLTTCGISPPTRRCP